MAQACVDSQQHQVSARRPRVARSLKAAMRADCSNCLLVTRHWSLVTIFMLNIPQIEALKRVNTHLYESLKRVVSGVNNLKLSLDSGVTDGADFARVSAAALTQNKVDPAKSGVLMRGSLPPTWSNAFTYASTTSSITWMWTSLAILRADGTQTQIANGSLAVTGLAAATTYFFYPYWDETQLALAFVAGGAGNPANAQSAKTIAAAQQQALQGRIPLSAGAMTAATTSSGTGGGSGGGSGSCLRGNMLVLTKDRGLVPVQRARVGDHIRGRENWTQIIRHEVHACETFVRLTLSNGDTVDVTPHHVFTLVDDAPVRAERLCLGDILMGRYGWLTLKKIEVVIEEGTKVIVTCEPDHEFFASQIGASVLTHNYNFSS
ncbi:MAG TPA: Hint domain-containing protein [Candidatus Acidoferrales bacterium]|nr:Hint domain-containing protein [Candidatus Acidoferrales bacterium]